MMLNTTCLLSYFNFGVFYECCIFKWVHSAAEHHILPNQNAVFISELIKVIVHIHTSTPDSYDVIIGFYSRSEEPFQLSIVLHSIRIIIERHLISTLHVDFLVIDSKEKVCSIWHRQLVELDFSYADLYVFHIH